MRVAADGGYEAGQAKWLAPWVPGEQSYAFAVEQSVRAMLKSIKLLVLARPVVNSGYVALNIRHKNTHSGRRMDQTRTLCRIEGFERERGQDARAPNGIVLI